MAFLHDDVHDDGLQRLTDRVTQIYICSQEPTTYAEASSTFALGVKSTPTISAPKAGDPNGREVEASSFSDGSVTATGTATHYAWVRDVDNEFWVAQALSASQAVTQNNTFSLTAHSVRKPAVT